MEKELEKEFEKQIGIGKAKVGLVVCAVLVAILAISNVLVYVNQQNRINALEIDNVSLQGQMNTLQIEKSSLEADVSDLETEKSNLKTQVNNLQTEVSNLQTEKSQLESQVTSLQTDKSILEGQVSFLETWLDSNKTLLQATINERNQLQTWFNGNITDYESQIESLDSQIATLQSQVNSLQTDKSTLEGQVTSLQDEIDGLLDEIDWLYSLISEYDEAMFFFYYVVPEEQKFGVYDLEDELYGLEWIEPYQEGVFDCSEMSAHLEWRLENEGWNAIIVVGDSPFGSGYHAWLLVECEEGEYMPVESTNIEIVWWSNPNFDNYFIYDYTFETILDALDYYSETEFDWWK